MQEVVHRTEPRDLIDQFHAVQGIHLEMAQLI
jgi:hypothetical protein